MCIILNKKSPILFASMLLLALFVSGLVGTVQAQYKPTWNSIDSRPLPQWYDDGKIGIFMHWGVYSVPSTRNEWFWYDWKTAKDPEVLAFMKNNFKPDFTYADFAPMFSTELFKPDQWADIIKASGAKYFVMTTKHHEGFTNWPSKYSFNWNSMDVGPNRDLVGELSSAIRKKGGVKFGTYYSLFEFFNPLYLEDAQNNYTTNDFVQHKMLPELKELINTYKPEIIWGDGDWMVDDFYWDSLNLLTWLYNESPVKDTVVVNDRWGKNIRCHHGGFFNCNDKFNPGVKQKRKWENAMTIDRGSWGYRREATLADFLTMEELLKVLATTISCGGNLLINVGPTHDGRIIPIFEERLRSLGKWLDVNGDAIYKSKTWTNQNDTINPDVWYTYNSTQKAVYAILLDWPVDETLTLGAPDPNTVTTVVTLLGYPGKFSWKPRGSDPGIDIIIPPIPANKMPCQWAWVFKLEGLNNYEPSD